MSDSISANIVDARNAILQDVVRLAREYGRACTEVRVLAVSKNVDADTIVRAYAAGQRLFGENRVQEADDKFSASPLVDANDIELHLIGNLQRNKVKKALKLFHIIQSVDTITVAQKIRAVYGSMEYQHDVKTRGVFLQVNPSGDVGKHGFSDYDRLAEAAAYCKNSGLHCPSLVVRGLMCIAPLESGRSSAAAARTFMTTGMWKERLEREIGYDYTLELSMGMSGDYHVAIREHSTMVRIGSALFGIRNAQRAF